MRRSFKAALIASLTASFIWTIYRLRKVEGNGDPLSKDEYEELEREGRRQAVHILGSKPNTNRPGLIRAMQAVATRFFRERNQEAPP